MSVDKPLFSGIDLGQNRDPKGPILKQFEARGLRPHPDSIPRWRSGRGSGRDATIDMGSFDFLNSLDASVKTAFYSKIFSEALEMSMAPTAKGSRNSTGFTSQLAERLKGQITQDEVRLLYKAGRADFSLAAETGAIDPKAMGFNDSLERYVDEASRFPSNTQKLATDLGSLAGIITPRDFYKLVYRQKPSRYGPRTRGVLPAYEDYLAQFYLDQQQHNQATLFDRLVVGFAHRGALASLGNLVTQALTVASGVDLSYEVLIKHRSLVIAGSPVTGRISVFQER